MASLLEGTEQESQVTESPELEIFTEEKRNPVYIVEIAGQNFQKVLYNQYAEEVFVEEVDEGLSLAKVVVASPGLRLIDDYRWEEKSEMRIWTSYRGEQPVLRGKFILERPKWEFGVGKVERVVLVGYGEAVLMGQTEKRRVFENMTDSEIAWEIANEYGFDTDIRKIIGKHEHVVQANETDMKFLERRAELHGFQVFVENGTLHFHPVEYEHSGIVIAYRKEDESLLQKFSVGVRTLRRGLETQGEFIDPLKNVTFRVKSEDVPDSITKEVLRGEDEDEDRRRFSKELVSFGEDKEQPMKYLYSIGQEQEQEKLQSQAEAISQASRYVVSGVGVSIGLPKLKARRILRLLGLKKFEGDYYVKRVVHRIRRGYRMEFEVRRTWTGPLKEGLEEVETLAQGTKRDVTQRSPVVGMVVMAR